MQDLNAQLNAALLRMPNVLADQTLNMEFKPYFLAKNRFAYKKERYDGRGRKVVDLMLFDAKEGGETLMADGRKLEKSLEKALGRPVDLVDEEIVPVALEETGFRFTMADGSLFALRTGRLSRQRAPLPQGAVTCPDGSKALYTKNGDLYLRDLAAGRNHRLTRDGKPENGYGLPDLTREAVARSRGEDNRPCGVLWSPDNRHFITYRTDYSLVNRASLPAEEDGESCSWPCARPGDEHLPVSRWILGDAETGELRELDTDPVFGTPLGEHGYAAWSEEGSLAALACLSRDFTDVKVYTAAAGTGETNLLFVEHNDKFLSFDLEREFHNQGETGDCSRLALLSEKLGYLFWLSNRSGDSQVWRYDLRNGSSRQLTKDGSQVCQLIALRPRTHKLYITIAGREQNTNPDHKYLYELELGKGGGLTLLSRTKGDNRVWLSPEGDWFLACASSYDTPQETTVQELEGGEIRFKVCEGDIEGLENMNFVFPIPVREPGADGKTEIRGMLFMPMGFDGEKDYPVVDLYYGGSQLCNVPVRFSDTLKNNIQCFCAMGMAAIIVDGRGTPHRGRKFLEHAYDNMADCGGLQDHVALLSALLDKYPFLDKNRVAVYGHSAGGYGALHCLTQAPQLYRCGVASAGNYDQQLCDWYWSERFMGAYDPERWEALKPDLTQLSGRLLLTWGTRDDCVPPTQSLQVLRRLLDLDKDVEALPVPGMGHGIRRDPHAFRRVLQFLAENLR